MDPTDKAPANEAPAAKLPTNADSTDEELVDKALAAKPPTDADPTDKASAEEAPTEIGPSYGLAATALPARPTGKRKRIEERGDDAGAGPHNPSDAKRRQYFEKEHFACPLLKANPGNYPLCLHLNLTSTTYVKQHILKEHRADISTENQKLLVQHKRTKQSEPEKWYGIFDLLFPDHPLQPLSPYPELTLEEDLLRFLKTLRDEEVNKMVQGFRDRYRSDRPITIQDILNCVVARCIPTSESCGFSATLSSSQGRLANSAKLGASGSQVSCPEGGGFRTGHTGMLGQTPAPYPNQQPHAKKPPAHDIDVANYGSMISSTNTHESIAPPTQLLPLRHSSQPEHPYSPSGHQAQLGFSPLPKPSFISPERSLLLGSSIPAEYQPLSEELHRISPNQESGLNGYADSLYTLAIPAHPVGWRGKAPTAPTTPIQPSPAPPSSLQKIEDPTLD